MMNGVNNNQDVIYLLNENELTQVYHQDSIFMDINQLYSVSDLYQYSTKELMENMVLLAGLFCLLLILFSCGLWMFLKYIQKKQVIRFIHQLNTLEKPEQFSPENPGLTFAYNNILQKFSDHWDDYKRLHAYLSHEQKNTIAILRAQLELSGSHIFLDSVDHLSDNIDDVLTLSESTEQNETGIVDVSLVCAAVCDDYKKTPYNIIFDFDAESSTNIVAKERWIYRAIANLVNNAIKYGEGKPIKVYVRSKNNSVIVIVKDYGIGISKKEQERIFKHQYRINELDQAGHGIGLSLVSHVADLCSGFIIVESEPNKGSTFYLSFPQNE